MVTMASTICMLVEPPLAGLLGMSDMQAGAFLGGSVDATGNVVAALVLIGSEEAEEIGIIVKMAQNMLLPFVVILISALKETVFKVPAPTRSLEAEAAAKDSLLWRIWSGLPKFIVGYLTLGLLLSAVRASGALGGGFAELQTLLRQAGNWFFAIGFVGV